MLPFTIQFTLDIHTRFKVRNIQRSKSPHQLCRLVIHFQCCFRTDLSHFVINFVYHLRYHLCKLSLLYPQVYHRCVDYGDLNKEKNDDHQNRIMHFLRKTTSLEVIGLSGNILRRNKYYFSAPKKMITWISMRCLNMSDCVNLCFK